MFYGVYYYDFTCNGYPTVYLGGYYNTLAEATKRLNTLVPNYKKYINNTVTNTNTVGWVNMYNFGDFSSELSVTQPHSAVCIT